MILFDERGPLVTGFRCLVLALVVFFFAQNFIGGPSSGEFGGNFRFLTIWGQTLSLVAAALMLGRSLGLTTARPDTFISVTILVNAMVLFLYWSLYFRDPALVHGSGGPSVWWREYYVHLTGPLAQMLDAFLIFGCFRAIGRILPISVLTFLVYVAWIEGVLRPLSTSPVGTATSGLPYPFLNDLAVPERLVFYATTIFTSLVFLAIGWLIAWLLRRFAGIGVAG